MIENMFKWQAGDVSLFPALKDEGDNNFEGIHARWRFRPLGEDIEYQFGFTLFYGDVLADKYAALFLLYLEPGEENYCQCFHDVKPRGELPWLQEAHAFLVTCEAGKSESDSLERVKEFPLLMSHVYRLAFANLPYWRSKPGNGIDPEVFGVFKEHIETCYRKYIEP